VLRASFTSNSVVENTKIVAVLLARLKKKPQKNIVLPKADLKHQQGFSQTAKTILLM
jgi:hypothetical protein